MGFLIGFIPFAVLTIAYLVASVRVIQPGEQAIVRRYGRFETILEPGLHLIIPVVQRFQRIDLSSLLVVRRIGPGAPGRIRIGSSAYDAVSEGNTAIEPSDAIRVVRVDGDVMVVTRRDEGSAH